MQAHYESTNRYFTEVTENILTSQLSIVSPKMQNLEATSEILTVSNPADRKNTGERERNIFEFRKNTICVPLGRKLNYFKLLLKSNNTLS